MDAQNGAVFPGLNRGKEREEQAATPYPMRCQTYRGAKSPRPDSQYSTCATRCRRRFPVIHRRVPCSVAVHSRGTVNYEMLSRAFLLVGDRPVLPGHLRQRLVGRVGQSHHQLVAFQHVYSYASPAFYEYVGWWLDAVCPIIVRHRGGHLASFGANRELSGCPLTTRGPRGLTPGHPRTFQLDGRAAQVAIERILLPSRTGTPAARKAFARSRLPRRAPVREIPGTLTLGAPAALRTPRSISS
jgi:hypothetical protein